MGNERDTAFGGDSALRNSIWRAFLEWLAANQRKNTAYWVSRGINDPALPVSVTGESWALFRLNNPLCGFIDVSAR